MGRFGQLALAAALLLMAVVAALALRHDPRSGPRSGPAAAPQASALAVTTSTSRLAASGLGAAVAATPGSATTTAPLAIPGATATPAIPPCATTGMSAAVTNLGVAAGTEYLQIALTNTSGARCRLSGYPGVTFLDAAGHHVGSPASPGSGAVNPVTVAPGTQAYSLLEIHDAALTTAAGCRATTASGVGVALPGQATEMAVAADVQVCTDPANTADAVVLPLSGRPAQS